MSTQNIPAHVPPELVKQWNNFTSPGMAAAAGNDPYAAMRELLSGPRIFYSPVSGRLDTGNWVVTRAEDMRRILQDSASFSSKAIAGFSHLLGETWDMIPLEVDPPAHEKFRAVLNPLFTPKRINEMSVKVRATAVELIEGFQRDKHCEFVEAFGRRFPVLIFMQLMGIPLEDYHRILDWEDQILHSTDMEVRVKGAHAIAAYLEEMLAARKQEPQDDLFTIIANAVVEGRPMTDTECLSMSLFLFVAGLDTVASSLGYQFAWLAQHPQAQIYLRENPDRIPTAVEELIRAFSVVITSRKVVRDVEVGGVLMKAGDSVSLPLGLANYDPEAFANADQIDLTRSPNLHIGFTVGPHRCLGSSLARREIILAVEEWTQRIPNFRLAEGKAPVARGGAVMGVDELRLVWD